MKTDFADKDWLTLCKYESTDLEWTLTGIFMGIIINVVVYRFAGVI